MLPCWFVFKQITVISALAIIVIAYYVVGFMQLFGYGLWGTLWRQAFVYVFIFNIALLLMHLSFHLGLSPDIQVTREYAFPAEIVYAFIGALVLGTGCIVNHIATRKARRQQR